MPIFDYQCDACGLRFEKMLKADLATAAQPCSRCGEAAERHLSAPAFAFGHTPDGARPQNTGATSVDLDFDRAVGRDAEQQWGAVHARLDRKRQIMAETGASGFDLTATPSHEGGPDGGYRVMQPEERRAAETGRGVHHAAVNKIKDYVKSRNKTSQPPAGRARS